MPFQKGHKGFNKPKTYRKTKSKTKDPNITLDLYSVTSKFKKTGKNKRLLDPDEVSHYLNNNMDVTELYGKDEEWDLGKWYDENGKRLSWYTINKKK